MKCPNCGSKLGIIDTLPEIKAGKFRRRKCKNCGQLFRTLEIIDDGSKEFSDGYSVAIMKKEFRRKNEN